MKGALDEGYVVFLVARAEGKDPRLMMALPETSTAATPERLAAVLAKIKNGESAGGMKRKEDDGTNSLVGYAQLTDVPWSVGVIQAETEYRKRHAGSAGKGVGGLAVQSLWATPFAAAFGNPWFLALLLLVVAALALAWLAAVLMTRGEEVPAEGEADDGLDKSEGGSTKTVRRVVQERRVEHVEEHSEEES